MDRAAAHNLSSNTGGLVESSKGYDPRLVSFYFMLAAMLLTLIGGLAYQQLHLITAHEKQERQQNQRRVLVPGPRGNIYARDGQTILVGNRPRFSVVLYLDELRGEIRKEYLRSRKAYRETKDKDLPTDTQLSQIARVNVTQRYLDQVNKILKRDAKVDGVSLREHFQRQLLLPYTLIDDLAPEDYAKLLEGLPVRSPVQVYTSSTRYYPFGSAAAHALGYIGTNMDITAADFPGEDLKTFKMKGTVGRDGLEKQFDAELQGEAGGTIFRVDPSGYKVNKPLEKRTPVQGKNLVTSLDIDLQRAAEEAIGDQVGAAVALDVRTGEVLVLASKPDYNLAEMSPRFRQETWDSILQRDALINRAIGGGQPYPPGSTFKILTSIAALRRGAINPTDPITYCDAVIRIGDKDFVCDSRHGHHGDVVLKDAIAHSCDIYYYEAGKRTTPEGIAEEARRFHLDERTRIDLPAETRGMLIPDPKWKQNEQKERWYPGDTANMSIGQGYILLSPLQMACFTASVARNETFTQPTLIHQPNRPTQRHEPIGLTPAQRAVLLEGMEGCITYGTGKTLSSPTYRIPGVRVAGKTGTAQKVVTKDGKRGNINFAWFICFAPAENPEIAIAVMLEGDTIGETFGGGANSGPVAATILKKYFEKKNRPALNVGKTTAN